MISTALSGDTRPRSISSLALVQDGDMIELDVAGRRLHLDVSDEELEARRAAWQPRHETYARGWAQLYTEQVTQADTGCDLDFLVGASCAYVPKKSH